MRTIPLLAALLFLSVSTASSQEKGVAFYWGARGAELGNSEMETYDLNVAVGYNVIPLLNLSVESDFSLGLYNRKDVKTYIKNGTLGAALGLNVLRRKLYILEVHTAAGNTIGASEWTFFYFDGGIRWSLGPGYTKMMLGAGVRYYKSHKTAFKDYTKGYLSVGMKFN